MRDEARTGWSQNSESLIQHAMESRHFAAGNEDPHGFFLSKKMA